MSMQGKTCLVTGANAGIGFQTAKGLAAQGAEVVLLCRNTDKGEAARKEIVADTGNDKIGLIGCDLSIQADIRKAATTFIQRYPRLDVLVNNAGAVFGKPELSPDGYEMQWAINHLGYFLLTHLLLDHIKASAPARIVNVSSGSHYQGEIVFDDLQFEKRSYSPMKVYAQTKLANVLFTIELSRRLAGTGVTANCLHPGVVRTKIGNKHTAGWMGMLWNLFSAFGISEEKGAATSIYLASSTDVEGLTGKYFDNCKEKAPSKRAHNEEVAEKLWNVSSEMVGL